MVAGVSKSSPNRVDGIDLSINSIAIQMNKKLVWLHDDTSEKLIEQLEHDSTRCLAIFQWLCHIIKREYPLMRQSLNLSPQFSDKDIVRAGERFGEEFELGLLPASKIVDTLEQKLSIPVLVIDTAEATASASIQLPEFDAMIATRSSPVEQRIFSIAHHLFRILYRDSYSGSDARSEENSDLNRMADLFAATILLPKNGLKYFGSWSDLSKRRLQKKVHQVSSDFRVPIPALKLRLVSLGELEQERVDELREDIPNVYGYISKFADPPPLFSKLFIEVAGQAMDLGLITVERMSSLLNITTSQLNRLFLAHQVLYYYYQLD